MKDVKVCLVLILLGLGGCKSDKVNEISLNTKWQVYLVAVVAIDQMNDRNACSYQTRVSDLYHLQIPTRCDVDDVYDFTHQDSLTISYGERKCSWDEPDSVTKPYEHKGDSILLDDRRYHIVSLSRDTLILDHCADMTITPRDPSLSIGPSWG